MRELVFYLVVFLSFQSFGQDAEELFQKGNALNSDGKYEEALMYVDSSLSIDSSAYQRYQFRAEINIALGQMNEAVRDITKCVERTKRHKGYYYRKRAELYLKLGESKLAMADINESLKADPGDWKSYNFRSLLHIEQEQYNLALDDLNKSIEFNDNEASTYSSRGRIKQILGDAEGACMDFKQVQSWGIDTFDHWIRKNCK